MKLLPPDIPISKRCFDLILSSVGSILLAPLLLVIGLLVWIYHGRPILFRQVRGGYRGLPFDVFKFRTMREARDLRGELLPDDRRLTKLGGFLRATSLDELPELFNVLRGEMSLIGPRPLFYHYKNRYSSEQARRHQVLPGITGWAQINGRNALTWEDKFRLDVWYVDHGSFWLDLKILMLTVWRVFQAQGVSQSGCATMPRFTGNHRSHD